MKLSLTVLALVIPLLISATPAAADDALSNHDIANVLALPEYAQLEGVRFYFGDAAPPSVAREIEANATTSLRTRKFGRSTEAACQWVMLSAMLQLRARAVALGGDAVINVRSNWRNTEWSSSTQYQCAAGFLMAGVALKGDVVSLR